MTPELKKQWLDALKSGKYTQGQRYLHNVDDQTHCCLGVLADIVPEIKEEEPGIFLYGLNKLVSFFAWGSEVGLSNELVTTLMTVNDKSDSYEPTIKIIEEQV